MNTVIKLVAIAKNEALYIPAWVHHHFRIGIDYIEVHINNTTDNSVEVCERISNNYRQFTYINSDSLFKESIDLRQSFQLNAYNQSLEGVKQSDSSVTHLLTLDIDEYLMPRDFKQNIKELVQYSHNVDIHSFLWYSDDYNRNTKSLKHPLSNVFKIYRMDHVKSMARVNSSLDFCLHHNFIYSDDYATVNQFSACGDIQLLDGQNTIMRQSVLTAEFLDTLDESRPEKWFILHQIYKSEVEYISSLFRGDECNGDFSLLKSNRWGMKPFPDYKSNPIEFKIDHEQIENYRNSYLAFARECDLKSEVKKARHLVINRYQELGKILQSQPELMDSHSRCFEGTKYESFIALLNRNQVKKFNSSKFFKFRTDILNIYQASNPEGMEGFVCALNKFYGYNYNFLSDFELSEFGYWHTQFFKEKYEKKGFCGNYWMIEN